MIFLFLLAMGFKIRAGMALGGMLMSYFFGLSFLSGIASHLDTTGMDKKKEFFT